MPSTISTAQEGQNCRNLWSAVLAQAIRDNREVLKTTHSWTYDVTNYSTRRTAKSALDTWFASKRYAPGSFLWICDVLEIDPRRVLLVKDKVRARNLIR